ncbi:thiamine pyrophosphate-dependent enzyme [Nitrospira lenta]|uniref:Putative dehydrogenase E1 component n=1 Tax=Nitrospira lenta TaxID=1436998 RepID=A0A330LDZ3_9BACT|nr:thiamine pyrophosphate-dependent enzyme [Nitrospira lenta]SPP65160.1 putative dehydrogenase E1 component [Nitrospira lenta]
MKCELEQTARTPAYGLIPDVANRFSKEYALKLFTQICFNRFFEFEVKKAYDKGLMKLPIYLSVGQEHIPAAIASVFSDCLIFAQHRAHSVYLSFGGDPLQLIDELLSRPSGCARGMGGSASIHSQQIGMFGHSGLMGDQVPIAVGAALGAEKPVLTVMGDASAEEDYIYGALGFAVTKKLPVLFVCEDNDLSILTRTPVRRSWTLCGLAQGLGLPAVDITDDPWLIAHHVKELSQQLPALINIRTCRGLWHAGSGCDGPPEWDRFALIKDTMRILGLENDITAIESDTERTVQGLWAERLQKS